MKGVYNWAVLLVAAFAVTLMLASQCPQPNRVTCQAPCVRGSMYENNTWCTMATESLCCEYNYRWYECDYLTDDDDNDPDPRCHPRLQWEPQSGPRYICGTCEKVPGKPAVVWRCERRFSYDCEF